MELKQQIQSLRRDVFIVRIWREETVLDWQGWVQHASSGESTGFRDLEELLVFIELHVSGTAPVGQKGLR